MDKQARLLELATTRMGTRWPGYKPIADYHGGTYECDFVSPFTKAAGNTDAKVFVLLQDWSSDGSTSGPFSDAAHGADQAAPPGAPLGAHSGPGGAARSAIFLTPRR